MKHPLPQPSCFGALRRMLRRFNDDVRGVTMTEFVVTLPVFIVIFVGIIELGALSMQSVGTITRAHIDAFDRVNRVQEIGLGELVDGNVSEETDQTDPNCESAALSKASVITPPGGAEAAERQLINLSPVGPSAPKARLLEDTAYAGLTLDGTTGLIHARVSGLAHAYETYPVTQAVKNGRKISQFVGDGSGGSQYARSLFKDNVNTSEMGGCEGGSEGASFSDIAAGRLNNRLSGTGSRPMLAAGLLYGTCAGCATDRIGLGPDKVESTAYMVMTMPPRRGDPELQAYYTTLISRMAMEGCRQEPYRELLGIERHLPIYPNQIGEDKLDGIPIPSTSAEGGDGADAAGFESPLDYGVEDGEDESQEGGVENE